MKDLLFMPIGMLTTVGIIGYVSLAIFGFLCWLTGGRCQ